MKVNQRIAVKFIINSLIIFSLIFIVSCGNNDNNNTTVTNSTKKNSKIINKKTASIDTSFVCKDNNNFYSINRFKSGRILAVGQNGSVMVSGNGGLNWSSQISGVTANLFGSYCIDNDTLIASGGGGTILRSSNKGVNWQTIASTVTDTLRTISFPDKHFGFICGDNGKILKTTNSGTVWTSLSSPTTQNIYGICFVNKDTGLVVGAAGLIYLTLNSGTSWTLVPSGTTKALRSVSFSSYLVGTAVGDTGTILQTQNGGTSWSQVYSPVTQNYTCVSRASNHLAYMCGKGFIIRSVDTAKTVVYTTTEIIHSISVFSEIQKFENALKYNQAIATVGGQHCMIIRVDVPNCYEINTNCSYNHNLILIENGNCNWSLFIRPELINNANNEYVKINTPGFTLDAHIAGWTQIDNIGGNSGLDSRALTNYQYSYSQTYTSSTPNNSYEQLISFKLRSPDAANTLRIDFTLHPLDPFSQGSGNIKLYFGNNLSAGYDTPDNNIDCLHSDYEVLCEP